MPQRTFDDRSLILFLAIFAFALRIVFLIRFAASPLFVPVSGGNDCWLYYSIAQRCAAGHWMPDGVFEYMPLYAWVLGAIASVAGSQTLLVAAYLGAVLDTATVVLIFTLARRCGAPQWAALGGAALFAAYPLAITYSALNMPNTMNAFFVTALAALLHGFTRRTPLWKWIAAGLFAGVACLSFAGMLLIAVLVAVWFSVGFLIRRPKFQGAASRSPSSVLRPLAFLYPFAFVAAAALPIVPVSVHNYRAEGHFVLITAHGGFNFYLGNHAGATGYPMLLPGFRGDRGNLLFDARSEAERLEGRPLKAAEFAKHWNDRAKKFIRENPGAEIRILGRKFLNYWNATEYDDLRMLPMLRLTDTAFTWPVWPGFALISILGFAGLLTARRCGLVRLITATTVISVILFFVTSRYRLTAVPLLCVVGAAGLRPVLIWLKRRGQTVDSSALFKFLPRDIRILAIQLVIAAVFAFAPVPNADFRSLDCYNTATHLLEKATQTNDGSLLDDALRYANEGLKLDPSSADLHFVAGNALFGLGGLPQAKTAYENAIKLNPRLAQALFNLAVVQEKMGDHAAAVSNATRAVATDPAFEQAKDFLKRMQNGSAPK